MLTEQSTSTHTSTNPTTEYTARWNNLKTFLNKWFYKPDMEALKIFLSIYVSHTYLEDDPIWAFIIGPSGSGKTAIIIRALSYLHNTHLIGQLTTSSFLSGFGDDNGVLQTLTKHYNGNGVLLFPDFSTFIGLRPDVRETLASEMRNIYDGYDSKQVGNKGTIEWNGKATMIAACTPIVEEHWALNRELGERYMYVRWVGHDLSKTAECALKQIGHEEEIAKGYKKRILKYVDIENLKPIPMQIDWKDTGLFSLAELVARLRVAVRREQSGNKRQIVSISTPELPTRIIKSMGQIARASATLDRRDCISVKDLHLAKRLAFDTLPPYRCAVLKELLKSPQNEIYASVLKKKLKLPHVAYYRVLEDLTAITAVETYLVDETEKVVTLTSQFKEICELANLGSM